MPTILKKCPYCGQAWEYIPGTSSEDSMLIKLADHLAKEHPDED